MMQTLSRFMVLAALTVMQTAQAAPRDDILGGYAAQAKAEDAAFTGFSAARGEALYRDRHTGGKADSPSCTSCHGENTRAAGRTPVGKAIDPVAVSVAPTRYTDAAKVEKWFRRNCREVLGRECSAREKGDWLAFMITQ
jgi:mono/diheme cytochrome c family protein